MNILLDSLITSSVFHSGGSLGTIEDWVLQDLDACRGEGVGQGWQLSLCYVRSEVGCWIQILCATTWAHLVVYILLWVCIRGELVVWFDMVHVG